MSGLDDIVEVASETSSRSASTHLDIAFDPKAYKDENTLYVSIVIKKLSYALPSSFSA